MAGLGRSALGTLKKILVQDSSATADQWPFSTKTHCKRKLSRSDDTVPAKRLNTEPQGASCGTYCVECKKHFSRPYVLKRHINSVHSEVTFVCDYVDGRGSCGASFAREDNLTRHRLDLHHGVKVTCWLCGGEFRKDYLPTHQATKTCYDNRRLLAVSKPYLLELHAQEDCVGLSGSHQVIMEDLAEHKFLAELEDTSVGLRMETVLHGDTALLSELSDGAMLPELEDTSSTPSYPSPRTPQTPTMQPPLDPCSDETANTTVVSSTGRAHDSDTAPDLPATDPLALHRAMSPETADLLRLETDSHRSVVQPDYFSNLMLDESDEAELIQRIQEARQELYGSGSSVREQAHLPLPRLDSQFLRASDETPGRFYRMDAGSECALCKQYLGNDHQSIYDHAAKHLIQDRSYSLKCSTCEVDFAFELDLRLHSSNLEIWSFCREMPVVESHGEEDWLAETSTRDREAFIALLRQWERLQLHWYAASIDKILANLEIRHPAGRSCVSTGGMYLPPKEAYTRMCASAFTCGPTHSIYEAPDVGNLTAVVSKMSFQHQGNHDFVGTTSADEIKAAIFAPNQSRRRVLDELQSKRVTCTSEAFRSLLQEVLHEATLRQHLVVLRALLKWKTEDDIWYDMPTPLVDVNSTGVDGLTALEHAAKHGLLASATFLIEVGARVNPPIDRHPRLSALDVAAIGGHDQVAELLLEKGAFVDRQGRSGTTALMHAVDKGHESVTRVLLQHDANIHIRNASNRTVLYDAERRIKPAILELLLAKGATREDFVIF